jgi:peptidoglycan/LPS O-acetylase OafA/YrhL
MNRQFPAFRGLAVFFVLINHSITLGLLMAQRLGHSEPNRVEYFLLTILKQFGLFAVPIFLFLSGAFFVFACQNRNMKQSYRIVWSNLLHVLWPYILWSIVFYLIIALFFQESYSIVQYAKDLIVGYPYNFVPLLMAFYVIAPVLIWLARRIPILVISFFLVLQLLMASIVYPGILGFPSPSWINIFSLPILRTPLADWGIFFTLGLIYSLHSKYLLSWLKRFEFIILGITILIFVLSILHELGVWKIPVAGILCPMFGVLLLPIVQRDTIPMVRQLEYLGKRAYGLYLTNLVVLTLLLFTLQWAIPEILDVYLILVPALITLTLVVQLFLMRQFERIPKPGVYRLVFG